MSVLVKGMEMPDKATTIVIFPEGKARVFRQDIDHDEWLTAIEVPKHGRLIDADALEKCGEIVKQDQGYYYVKGVALTSIYNAPTIIEAEGTEE